jgi:glycosyltransferase involved in cell wall biosynthesis
MTEAAVNPAGFSAGYRFFSVIIPSFNRRAEIEELLDSFTKLDFLAEQFEVIVSDDGSTDDTESCVADFQSKVWYTLKYIVQKNQGPGAARNLGMVQAQGDFFIFVDSDVTVPPYWLKNIAEKVNISQADAFGGPDTFLDSFPPLLKAINYSMTSFITTGGLRGRKGKKLAKFYPRSFNMGLSRKLFEKIGGFNHLRHGQDIEYSSRIIRSGARVVYADDAPVYHKRRTNLRRFYRQVFNWGVARINLYKIDHSMLEPLHAMPAVATLITLLALILAMFSKAVLLLVQAGLALAAIILIFSMIDAWRMYRQIQPALLLPLVMPAQVFGYGLGFIFNFIRRVIFKRGEKVGFRATYYK